MSEDYNGHIDDTLKYFGKVKNDKITKRGVEIPFIFNMIQEAKSSTSAFFYNKAIINYCLNYVWRYARKDIKIHPNWIVSI